MVTGATSGLGCATAKALAARGAVVIVVGRNLQRAEETVRDIHNETGNTAIDYLLADFASLAAVRKLAADFASRYQRLDVLVNNAGAFYVQHRATQDGLEMTIVVNHLSHFLLTNLLLEMLQASAPARIINVSSDAHHNATMSISDPTAWASYRGFKAYAQSKLANVLFTYELARRLDGTRVTANAVHPGYVATNIGANYRLSRLFKRIINITARSVEEGARTSIYLAISPEVESVSGKYFADCKPVQSSPLSYDEAVARQLWEVSTDLVGLGSASYD